MRPRQYLAGLTPTGVQDSEELYLISADGGHGQGPRRPDGHQAPARGRRARASSAGNRCSRPSSRWATNRSGPSSPPCACRCPSWRGSSTPSRSSFGRWPTRTRGSARCRSASTGCATRSRGAPGSSPTSRSTAWPLRTIAIESEDQAAVANAVRVVGLGARVNTSYPRGLGALFDGEPPRYATIDVGTNSVKFHIGQPQHGRVWQTLVDRAEVTQLGEGLAASGVISTQATARTVAAIDAMVDEARAHLVREIAAVGTAGLRMASNPRRSWPPSRPQTGVVVEVISGEEESRLAYLAAACRPGPGDGIGGRLRHRWGQLPVHLRRGPAGRRAVQRQRGCGPLHRALRSRWGGEPGGARRGAGRHRGRPRAPRRSTGARGAGRDGRGRHEHHGRATSGWRPTTRTRCRARSSSAPRWTARSSCTGPGTPTPGA